MRKLDQETAISAIELQQLVAEYCHELDTNNGLDITAFYTDDCNFVMGGKSFRGHAAVKKFYADRLERVRAELKDGVRTQRHTITNLRVSFQDKNEATLNFVIVNYSAGGKTPVFESTAPTAIADGHMECRREADGQWRIAVFDNVPLFLGNDPFLNSLAVKK